MLALLACVASQRTSPESHCCDAVYVSSEEKVKAGWPGHGGSRVPSSQSQVAIAIYFSRLRADCHSADIGVGEGREDGSLPLSIPAIY